MCAALICTNVEPLVGAINRKKVCEIVLDWSIITYNLVELFDKSSMKEVQLNRTFLKNPLNGVGLFMGLILLVEGLAWTAAYNTKLSIATSHGGSASYFILLLRSYVLPEVCTAFILVFLLNQHHTWLRLTSVDLTLRGVSRYEFKLLFTIFLAFLVFNPFTQTVRFLLDQFPDYSLTNYLDSYLLGTFRWDIYFRYLVPVFVLSYLLVNISFFNDYSKQRQQAQETAEAQAAETMQQALALSATFTPKSTTPAKYLSSLKGKNTHGELDFPVNDVYYFTVEERFYYAEMIKGRYLIGKTLNDLEAELEPAQFFRIKRDYIVNRQAVLSYAYWENGKYIVRLNTPDRYEIIVPRARMQEFREWLQGNQQPYADTDSDPFVLTS